MDPIYSNPNNPSFSGTRPGESTSILDEAKDKASELLGKAKDKAYDAMDSAKQTYSQAGDRLQEGGEYVRERAAEGLEEATSLIRRNPVPALLISFCAGFFLCQMLKD